MDILIVGCGIAGPALASFLLLGADKTQKAALRITILERSSELRPYGQNVDIRGYGVTMLRKLGLEAAVRNATTGEAGVQLVDSKGRIWASNEADTTGKVQTPTSDIEILRGRLAQLMWRRSVQLSEEGKNAGGPEIIYKFGDYISQLKQDLEKVQVTFGNSGETAAYDVVVGADGAQSHTRKLVWGAENEEPAVRSLNVYGAFFSIPKEDHDTKWRKWFHTTGGRAIMLRPDDSDERSTVFMTIMNHNDQRLAEVGKKIGKEEEKKNLMKEYFQGTGWETDRIVREMEDAKDFYYDVLVQVKMESWSNGRVVLLGDAGYCPSPMSGMGTTLALTGAHSLANALLRNFDSPAAAFREYQDEMKPNVDKSQKLAPGMPRWLHPQSTLEVFLLHITIFLFDRCRIFEILAMLFGPPGGKLKTKDD